MTRDNFSGVTMQSYFGLLCFISLLLLNFGFTECSELVATSDCACVGQSYTYRCSVNGGSGDLTVWSGSVIEVGCEIVLYHNRYESMSGASGECNNGAVFGQSIEAINNSYTSQLTIQVNNDLDRRTVECSVDNGIDATLINSSTLLITKAPLPSPTNIKLLEANPTELTFNWIPPSDSCPFLTYNIEVENCGICPNSTAQPNMTCTNFTLSTMCMLKVYSVVCGNLISTNPSVISANLTVPNITSTLSTPYYSDGNNVLIRVETVFTTTEPVNISDGINGSITSYNIIYSDDNSGSMCGSSMISPDASCEGRICRDVFNTSSSQCSLAADIRITIVAANIIGEVPAVSVSKAGTNKFVDVNFISSLRSIECNFLDNPLAGVTTCSANLTYGVNCDVPLGVYSSSGPTNLLRTTAITFINDISDYCFTINASTASETVIIEGTLNVINLGSVDIAPIVAPFVLVAIIFGALALTFALLLWYKYEPPIPVTIRFSNEDKPGSLAKMLKVFKDYNVNIIRINAHWQESDLKRTFRARRKENFLHLMCTKGEMDFLRRAFDFEFLDDLELPSQTESDSDAAMRRSATAIFYVSDKPGALYNILRTFTEGCSINILGLNTRSSRESIEGYKDNYVSCSCSDRKRKKIQEALMNAGAMKVSQELITPTPRKLKFFIRDEVGSLVQALKVFSDLNINVTSINSTALDVSRPLTHIVECKCRGDDRQKLLNQLTSCATNVKECEEALNAEIGTENESESSDYFSIEFTLRNEVGSLVSALEVFHTLHINIMGINTQKKDPKYFIAVKEVDYQYIEIEFGVSNADQEQKLIENLQATGMVIEAKPEESDLDAEVQLDNMCKKYCFAIRDEPGALAKALLVFNEQKVNITRIQDMRLNPDFKYTPLTVQYKCNYVEFVSTSDQEAKLKKNLQATGLAVDVKPYDLDDLQGADDPGGNSLGIEP